jgi:hypothetical protein
LEISGGTLSSNMLVPACSQGDVALVDNLLKQGLNFKTCRNACLDACVLSDNVVLARRVLAVPGTKWNPTRALKESRYDLSREMLEFALDHGANPKSAEHCFVHAVEMGDWDMLRFLLPLGMSNYAISDALEAVKCDQDPELINLLEEFGIDTDQHLEFCMSDFAVRVTNYKGGDY